jgi:hypothetical protein
MLTSKTDSRDLQLFQKLEIEPFEVNHQKQIFLGMVILPFASISVYVTCMPAQFWEFEIEPDEGEMYKVKTGSGTLSDYWQSIVLITSDCLVIEK